MGLFKQLKDMKDTVAAAPGMIEQAQQLKANAEAMQAAQMAQMNAANAAATAAAVGEGGPDFEPINGVSLELYAEISKGLAAVGYDQSQAPVIAASKGVSASDWDAAMNGWNARMQTNPAVAKRFNALYMGRA
jgi:hypothetical protein